MSIRLRRVARRMRQEDLAREAQLSRRAVVDIESGRIHPRRATLYMLARALGCEPGDLAKGFFLTQAKTKGADLHEQVAPEQESRRATDGSRNRPAE